jgi:hypothetical protein
MEPVRTLEEVLGFLGEARSPDVVADLVNRAFACRHSPGYEDPKIRDSGGIHGASVGSWIGWPAAEVERLWAIAADVATLVGYVSPRMTSAVHGVD